MSELVVSTRIFISGAYLSYVALFRWLRPVTYVASKILMPLGQILFFTLLGVTATGRDSAPYYLVGNAVLGIAISGIYGVTMAIGGERWDGTLPYLFGSPASRLAIFLGRAFMHVVDGMLGLVVGLGWGVLLGLDLSHANPGALALTALVTAASTSGLGLLMGSLSLVALNVFFVNNTVYFLLMALAGVNVPVANLPGWVQWLPPLLPLTRGVEAARRAVAGASLGDVAPLLAGELAVGLAFALVGYFCFRWFEWQARSRGTLESM